MSPQSVRIPAAAHLGAVRAQIAKPDGGGLSLYIGLIIWLQVIFVTVDFANFNAGPIDVAAALAPNPVTRVLKLVLIATGLFVIIYRAGQARALLRRVNRFFLAFLLLAMLSLVWSYDPGTTTVRLVGLASTTMISIGFCLAGWHRQRFQALLRPVCTFLLAASIIFCILYPQQAIDHDAQAGWHGLAIQKNAFGELAGFGILFWMHGLIAREVKGWQAVLGTAVGVTCLILSKSSTTMLATFFAIVFMLLALRMPPAIRRHSRYFVIVFASVIVLYAVAVLKIVPGLDTILLGPITALTGKDMTFSNRSLIWEIVKAHASQHPILGTGYGGYWTNATPASASYEFFAKMYFWPSESHNGYLEIFNDLGFVGLAVLLGFLVSYVRQSLLLFRLDRPQGVLYLALFFQQATTNLSESCWFAAQGILPVTVVFMAVFSIARSLQEAARSRVPAGRSSVSSVPPAPITPLQVGPRTSWRS